LLCDGSAVSTNTYSDLFAVIGTTYGGATTNMNLPDLRNRVGVGLGSGSFSSLNATGGFENVTLTTNQIPSHNHNTLSAGYQGRNVSALATGSPVDFVFTGGGTPYKTGSSGGNLSHSNMPPYIVVNYIIYAGK